MRILIYSVFKYPTFWVFMGWVWVCLIYPTQTRNPNFYGYKTLQARNRHWMRATGATIIPVICKRSKSFLQSFIIIWEFWEFMMQYSIYFYWAFKKIIYPLNHGFSEYVGFKMKKIQVKKAKTKNKLILKK